MKWRWLAVVGVSFMLSACAETFPVCPSVSGVAKISCYHYLEITKESPGPGEAAMGKVAESVVKADIARIPFWEGVWEGDYELKDYNFFEYLIHANDSDLANLKKGNKYMFVSEPNQPLLKVCQTKECNEAVEEFKKFDERYP